MSGTLIIRADSSEMTGIGHIMRCIALGQAWHEQYGGNVTFISHCQNDALRQRILDKGFAFFPLSNPHPHPSDLKLTLNILKSFQSNESVISRNLLTMKPWFVLDGYNFTPDYQHAIRDAGYKLLLIDDYNNLPNYHSDILLNPNISAESLNYVCNEDTIKLLGTKYVPLRKEFRQYNGCKKKMPEKAGNLLVTLGGTDPNNVALKVIEALNQLSDAELEARVVLGPSNPNIPIIEQVISDFKLPVSLIHAPTSKEMVKAMTWADLAVSAGGSTCWELCFCQVPMLVVIVAENQNEIGWGLDQFGAAKCLGWHEEMASKDLASEVINIVDDKSLRINMVKNARECVDGSGVQRVLKVMGN